MQTYVQRIHGSADPIDHDPDLLTPEEGQEIGEENAMLLLGPGDAAKIQTTFKKSGMQGGEVWWDIEYSGPVELIERLRDKFNET